MSATYTAVPWNVYRLGAFRGDDYITCCRDGCVKHAVAGVMWVLSDGWGDAHTYYCDEHIPPTGGAS